MKPKLLIVELWQVGDLTIATPFLRKACEKFDVTLLAKPFALDLQKRFWPPIKVIPFSAPWTAFNNKYNLLRWPWRNMFSVWKTLRRENFDIALSARWGDPRDHFLLQLSGAKVRLGFPRTGSQVFLTQPLTADYPKAHRYEYWRILAQALNLDLDRQDKIQIAPRPRTGLIIVHSGAAQPARVWPLRHYFEIVKKLRADGRTVRIICNPDQLSWWQATGEKDVSSPATIRDLIDTLDTGELFVGNDSGPGHLAAFCGLPTFTLFGPQVAEWFVPLHPKSEFMEGKACPYKPCSDYCRFPVPLCLVNVTEEEVWPRLKAFVDRQLDRQLSGESKSSVAAV